MSLSKARFHLWETLQSERIVLIVEKESSRVAKTFLISSRTLTSRSLYGLVMRSIFLLCSSNALICRLSKASCDAWVEMSWISSWNCTTFISINEFRVNLGLSLSNSVCSKSLIFWRWLSSMSLFLSAVTTALLLYMWKLKALVSLQLDLVEALYQLDWQLLHTYLLRLKCLWH